MCILTLHLYESLYILDRYLYILRIDIENEPAWIKYTNHKEKKWFIWKNCIIKNKNLLFRHRYYFIFSVIS